MKQSKILRQYIWLIDIISRSGGITLQELNERWIKTELSEGVAMTGTVGCPIHTADVAIVVTSIPQSLCELGTADTCQPIADIIAICCRVCVVAMQLCRCQSAQGIIRVFC